MKSLLFFPLLIVFALASEGTIEIDHNVLIDALKKFEGTKITLPKELVDELHLIAEDTDGR